MRYYWIQYCIAPLYVLHCVKYIVCHLCCMCIYLYLLPEIIWCLWTSPDSCRHSSGQSETLRIGSELGHSSQQIRELKLCHRMRWERAAICWAPQVFLELRTTFSHVVIHHLPPFQLALFGALCGINACDSEVRYLTCVFLGLTDLCAGVRWRSTH